MAKPTVYLESTIIGYGASKPSGDLVVAARQKITRDWLAAAAHEYQLFVSQPVIGEVSAGDEQAARERLALIEGIPLLAVTDDAGNLPPSWWIRGPCRERRRRTRSISRWLPCMV